MIYWIAANIILLLHLGFVCFVVAGGLLVFKWRWIVLLHIPAVVWGALIEFKGWICPLTPWENDLRLKAGEAGYSGGFVEHYILSILYPSGLDRDIQLLLGILVISINLGVYFWLFMFYKKRTYK